jgi:hypothetical protein
MIYSLFQISGHAWLELLVCNQCDVQFVKFQDCTVRLWNIEDSDKIPIVLEKKKAIGVKITKVSHWIHI